MVLRECLNAPLSPADAGRTAQVEQAIRAGLDQAEGVRGLVDVYRSEADLPERVRREIQAIGEAGNFYGAYDAGTGRILFVAENIPSEQATHSRQAFSLCLIRFLILVERLQPASDARNAFFRAD